MVSDANSGYSTWRKWLQDVSPSSERPEPKLIPEIEPTYLSEGDNWARSCLKSEQNHPRYIPITDLQLHQLPDGWRHQQVLSDVQAVARRVVKLTVKKRSSARAGEPRPGGHVGTGFVTFHPRWGAVVHTCKHVVFDCFEADNTMVTFFLRPRRQRQQISAKVPGQLPSLPLGVGDGLLVFRAGAAHAGVLPPRRGSGGRQVCVAKLHSVSLPVSSEEHSRCSYHLSPPRAAETGVVWQAD